jgi:lysophospholipase L1-like esterase
VKRSIVALAVLLGQAPAFAADPPFELVDGDRVVLIGGTMIERDQSYGYLETRLTRRYPDRSITFRNLGWSGDTVEGVSRAGFGAPIDGYKHLVEHVLALRPTVLIVGYGANEAFEGRAGLPRFLKGLDTLLKAVEPTKARLVFLSPTRQEDLGPPLPDPTVHNADLALYRDAIKAEARRRGAVFVDLFDLLPDGSKATPRRPLTTNGIHFTPYGYWRLAAAIEEALIPGPRPDGPGEPVPHEVRFAQVASEFKQIPGGITFQVRDKLLPAPPPPDGGPPRPGEGRETAIYQLNKTGRYVLKVDGQPVGSGNTEADPSVVIAAFKGPEFDQVEALRSAINAKNELYFYRWRPQNETYLFGFRKHEQGQNAREIPQFDPLVATREAEIARLRVPVPHAYELIREGEVPR